MTFENQDIRVIAPMDPNEGRRYIEPIKDEVVRGWDHVYNISEDILIRLLTKNWVGATLARSPLILMMCWKIGKTGCMKYHSENEG